MTNTIPDSSTRWQTAISKGDAFEPSKRLVSDRLHELKEALFNPAITPLPSDASNAIFAKEEHARLVRRFAANPDDPELGTFIKPLEADTHEEVRQQRLDLTNNDLALEDLNKAYKSPALTPLEREYFYLRHMYTENPNITMQQAFSPENRQVARERFGYAINPEVARVLDQKLASLTSANDAACAEGDLGELQPAAAPAVACQKPLQK